MAELDRVFEKQLEGRIPSEPAPAGQNSEIEPPEADSDPVPQKAVPEHAGGAPHGINNHQDVIRQLDVICAYYERHEPGSPVPLLLKRARDLVDKSFLEIVEDLAPDSVNQIKHIISGSVDE